MMLDVNMGAPLVRRDRADGHARCELIQSRCDLPLCLDSSIIEVLEAGLATYQGKALVNSVTAEDDRLAAILPLVKRHGAAVIALPNDEEEIPEEPARRLELARKIVDVATGTYGIALEDIVFDPLAMPIGADTSLVLRTLETIELLREELGVNMTLGASNVSFGMPERGCDRCRVPADGDRQRARPARSWTPGRPSWCSAVKAADLLTNRDPWGAAWIAAHRARQAQAGAGQQAARHRGDRGPAGTRRDRRARLRPDSDCDRRRHTGAPVTAGSYRRTSPARRPGSSCTSCRPGCGCACRPACRCSTPPAGTASRSTRPAAATARARNARSGSWTGRARLVAGRARVLAPTSCGRAGGWPAGRWPTPTCRSRCRRW